MHEAEAVRGIALVKGPKMTPAGSQSDVAEEQLSYLAEHAAEGLHLDCPECRRLIRARAVLLEPFE